MDIAQGLFEVETRGLLLFDEQFLEIAAFFAGYTPQEANPFLSLLQRRPQECRRTWRPDFLDRATARGIPRQAAESAFDFLHDRADLCRSKASMIGQAITINRASALKSAFKEFWATCK